jgi:hypothetical protein
MPTASTSSIIEEPLILAETEVVVSKNKRGPYKKYKE